MTITRETIELAALAAGHLSGGQGYGPQILERTLANGTECYREWRPHTDIGDAARLAVWLGIRVTPPKHKGDGSSAEPTRGDTASCTAFRADPVEQTCVAITLCAAEIGRKMKGNQA